MRKRESKLGQQDRCRDRKNHQPRDTHDRALCPMSLAIAVLRPRFAGIGWSALLRPPCLRVTR